MFKMHISLISTLKIKGGPFTVLVSAVYEITYFWCIIQSVCYFMSSLWPSLLPSFLLIRFRSSTHHFLWEIMIIRPRTPCPYGVFSLHMEWFSRTFIFIPVIGVKLSLSNMYFGFLKTQHKDEILCVRILARVEKYQNDKLTKKAKFL